MWTLEELDLDQPLLPLEALVADKQNLVETLFTILPSQEIREVTPDNLRVRSRVLL